MAPGTGVETNPNAVEMLNRDTIFTNVAVTEDNQPWWEGLSNEIPKLDWTGKPYDATSGKKAAHPNSRFTVAANQCRSYSSMAEADTGVPISAIIFGGRRKSLAPLVYEAKSWAHGVMVGASVASETTAAAVGKVGVVRRDPMAMKPFCGYNFGDYWGHWLSLEQRAAKLPKIFHVNWFRQNEAGHFLWPGFGENLRVLQWVLARCEETGDAIESPIGWLPDKNAINTEGLAISPNAMEQLVSIDIPAWQQEMQDIAGFFEQFNDRFPQQLKRELDRVMGELSPTAKKKAANSA